MEQSYHTFVILSSTPLTNAQFCAIMGGCGGPARLDANMRTIRLPYDPEGAYEFIEDAETWVPMFCPLCEQGYLYEEWTGDEWLYTCWHPIHPMYACHTQFVVEPGLITGAFGTWKKSVEKLTALGVLPLWHSEPVGVANSPLPTQSGS